MKKNIYKNLKLKVILTSVLLILLGIRLLFMSLGLLPDFSGQKIYGAKEGLWALFLSVYSFYICYKVLTENEVTKFLWAVVLFLFGLFIIPDPMISDISTHRIFFPAIFTYLSYSSYMLLVAARSPQEKSRKILSYLLILVNFILLFISYKMSFL